MTTASRRRPGPRKRLTGEERRQSFLDAAARMVGRQGLESVTMEGVAAELGVNKALPYRYFRNRDSLLLALFEQETAAFDARVAEAIDRAHVFEECVRAVIETYLDEIESSSLLVTQFEVSRPSDDPFETVRRQREERTVAFIVDLVRSEYEINGRDAIILVSVLASGSQGVVGLVQRPGWSRKRIVDVYIDLFIGAAEAVAAR